jgi:hypothetical protein
LVVDNWTSAMGDELAGGERLRFEVEGAGEVSAILVAGESSVAAGAGTRRGSRDQPFLVRLADELATVGVATFR